MSIHVVACISLRGEFAYLFVVFAASSPIAWAGRVWFMDSPADGYLEGLYFLAIVPGAWRTMQMSSCLGGGWKRDWLQIGVGEGPC